MKKTILYIILTCLVSTVSFAQKIKPSDLSVTGHAWYGYDVEQIRPVELKTCGYMTYEASVGIQTNPDNSGQYALAFGFPKFSFGLSVANMADFKFYDHTRYPQLYSLFGSFERSLYRSPIFSCGYLLDFGATYNPGKYDPVANPGNNWLSAPFMAYFGAGAFAKFHVGKHWEIGFDAMFRHYSNGRLALPNEALNAVGGGLFARYNIGEYDWRIYKDAEKVKPEFKKGMQYMVTVGAGMHTCQAEWNVHALNSRIPTKEEAAALKKHPKFSLSFDATYRYAMRYASGIGLDLFYSSNMEELEAADRILYGDDVVDACPGYSPLSVGIAFVQEVYFGNFAVHVALGAYPYRRKGVNDKELNEKFDDRERGWHYEKAGFRYYFPSLGDTFLGFAIKSHSIKAEYLEFSAGVRF